MPMTYGHTTLTAIPIHLWVGVALLLAKRTSADVLAAHT